MAGYICAYVTLGLDRSDFERQDSIGIHTDYLNRLVKQKYRDLSLRFHPDKTKGDPRKFQDISSAYASLKSLHDRLNYTVIHPARIRPQQSVNDALVLFNRLSLKQSLALYQNVVAPDNHEEAKPSAENTLSEEQRIAQELADFVKKHGGHIFVGLQYIDFPHREIIKLKFGRLAALITKNADLGLGYRSLPAGDKRGALVYVRTPQYKAYPCKKNKGARGTRCPSGLACTYFHPGADFDVASGELPILLEHTAVTPEPPTNWDNAVETEPTEPSIAPAKVCSYFLRGECTRGSSCNFLHPCKPGSGQKTEKSPAPPPPQPDYCPFYARGFCRFGDSCNASHATPLKPPAKTKKAPAERAAPAPAPAPGFSWGQLRGRKKVIVIGGTGQGKSTFINSVHNFFRGTTVDAMEAVIDTRFLKAISSAPPSTEMDIANTTSSNTELCTEYLFSDPRNPRNQFIIVDTPGLGDTRGTKQDEENLKMILQVAADAEAAGELSGFIFVCKGTENKRTLSVDTVMTVIRGSLPDKVMESMVAVITNCAYDFAVQCGNLLPPEISHDNIFTYDNPAFHADIPSLNVGQRRMVASMWSNTMERVGEILMHAARMQHRGGCTDMRNQRHRVMRIFHEIRTKMATLQQTMTEIEKAEEDLKRAKDVQASNANFQVSRSVTKRVFVPDPSGRHHTTCSTCTHICHESCGLNEISNRGDNAFTGCYAFSGSTCRICPNRCSYTSHYHGRDLVKDQTSTVDEIVKELQDKYNDATKLAGEEEVKVKTSLDMKNLISRAMNEIVDEMRTVCESIKQLCRGFNMVHELNLLIKQLEAEQRLLTNLEAHNRADLLINSVRALANEFSRR
eukprot:gene7913-9432_t